MRGMSLRQILNKARELEDLAQEEILFLLGLTDPREREELFRTAREAREQCFRDKVFLYGFVYFSTHCRNDCTFCYYRKSNGICTRYRKTVPEICEAACSLAESGVHLIDLTMGEDPKYLCSGMRGFDELGGIVENVKKAAGLPIMISPGVVPKDVLLRLKAAGADWYACYQETHDRKLYGKLRLYQSYDERWEIKLFAKENGILIEEGLLVGVGNSLKNVAHSLLEMKRLEADQVRSMSFVPQDGTPLYSTVSPTNRLELNIIAVMRLMFPDRLIPASLDVEGISGLKERLMAGANVVTSLIPPSTGLMGVSQSTLDIEDGNRTVQGIRRTLEECGLNQASLQDYVQWMYQRQQVEDKKDLRGNKLCGVL